MLRPIRCTPTEAEVATTANEGARHACACTSVLSAREWCIIARMLRKVLNPFAPGAGEFPPLVAGRGEERHDLAERLARVRAGRSGGIVVLYGPRGNGKTTLLAELESKAKKGKVQVRELKPSQSSDGEFSAPWKLAEGSLAPEETTVKRVLGLTRVLSRSRETRTVSVEESVEDIPVIARSGPLLLLVDEAHELPVAFGKTLLHHTQSCVKSQAPLFAVFAGTPGLPARFRLMHASFWERAERFKIGRFGSDDEVREALSVPAKLSGFPIDDDALDLLVRQSQRYPFFVQILGSEAWKVARRRGGRRGRIVLDDVQVGMRAVNRKRVLFYEERREEILSQGILHAAEEVSRALLSRDDCILSGQALGEILVSVSKNSKGTPAEMKDKLVALGVIWDAEVGEWEPGIPSLCAYLVENAGRDPFGNEAQ